MEVLLHPTYFPSITTFSAIVQHNVIWEAHDNFQKQTYRNRCYISTDQGKHMLNIPIKHVGGNEGRQKYVEVEMDNSSQWKKIHWRTLETAYRTSPFFEFYEDDIKPLFESNDVNLYEFNLTTIETISGCLGLGIQNKKTENYELTPAEFVDYRSLVLAKKELNTPFTPYNQVFEERNGFISNLSILDLLFNEGPNALSYLKNQSLDFLNV
ncbi:MULTISPECIES: WbqC family protein [Flavobacteriaceae]|uniref:WbqC family protein n=1 Tax=Flavobacteriaceae TaxID=49546 RepID=UPI001492DFD1|nr:MULTISPECIES: WbqC family protein [Allomuricauda]MDC6367580.1 WbqC family protein [Muricauda sp. AC10]